MSPPFFHKLVTIACLNHFLYKYEIITLAVEVGSSVRANKTSFPERIIRQEGSELFASSKILCV